MKALRCSARFAAITLIALASGCGGAGGDKEAAQETSTAPAPTAVESETNQGDTASESQGIRPVAGGFGGRFASDELQAAVLLVVLTPDSPTIDRVLIVCEAFVTSLASGTTFRAQIVAQIGTNVPIAGGTFQTQGHLGTVPRGLVELAADLGDVSLTGTFVSPKKATGTIRGLTEATQQCGIPGVGTVDKVDEARWTASCAYRVQRTAKLKREPGITLGPTVVIGDRGRKVAFLKINSTKTERGFSLKPASC